MFAKLSFNNITESISSAAQRTQEQFSSAIEKIHLDDPETRLSLLKRKHQLQETLGTVQDISQLPPQYKFLEEKSDALEKICKRLLVVTKTYEVEGYDYPPNLSESLNDWWSLNKDSLFSFSKKKADPGSETKSSDDSGILPRSFALALSKATADSAVVLKKLKAEELESGQNLAKKAASTDELEGSPATEEEDDEEEEDEDVDNLIKIFEAWTKSQVSIDQSKDEMDKLMAKEFNNKLTKLIEEDFKKGHELRAKVEDSRLKFDTLRHEIKIKQLQKEEEAANKNSLAQSEGKDIESTEIFDINNSTNVPEESEPKESEPKESEPKKDPTEPTEDIEDSDHKLFEKMEDQFVSITSETVEYLGELTDSSEIISLVKLFHNFQLLHYKQCVKNLEANLTLINTFESEDK